MSVDGALHFWIKAGFPVSVRIECLLSHVARTIGRSANNFRNALSFEPDMLGTSCLAWGHNRSPAGAARSDQVANTQSQTADIGKIARGT